MVLSVLRVFLLFDKINYDTAEKLQKLKSIEVKVTGRELQALKKLGQLCNVNSTITGFGTHRSHSSQHCHETI